MVALQRHLADLPVARRSLSPAAQPLRADATRVWAEPVSVAAARARSASLRAAARVRVGAAALPSRVQGHSARWPAVLLLLALAAAGCGESLPARIQPQDALTIQKVIIGQGAGAAGIQVSVTAAVVNAYEETFEGLVDLRGNVRIWWPRHPDVTATLPLRGQQYLTLEPEQRYLVGTRWYLGLDDGRNMMSLLDFTGNDVRHGVQYARPETLMLEIEMTVFEATGLLRSGPHEFVLEGWRLAGAGTGEEPPAAPGE